MDLRLALWDAFFFCCWSCHDSCWECVPGLVEFFGGLRISWNNCELVRADLSCLLVFGKALNQISLRFLASAMVKHYNQLDFGVFWALELTTNHSSQATCHPPWQPHGHCIWTKSLAKNWVIPRHHTVPTIWRREMHRIPWLLHWSECFESQAHNQQPMQKSMENMNLAHIKRPSCSKAVAQPTLKGN